MSYIASWSGGKDSCFALYKAKCAGYHVSHLVNFISKRYQRVSFHGTEAKLIQMQSEALGIPVVQKETTPDAYEKEFKEAVRQLIPGGVEGMVFGDIYLEEHKQWVERVCSDLEIEAVEPLWGKTTESVLKEFIDAGFEAVIISTQSKLFDKKWLGKRVDKEFLQHLKKNSIEICGENGEYHTVVVDGPGFNKRIKITKTKTIKRDGYWFLDTVKYSFG
jgi:diphthine-ammonia ligase